MNQNTFGLVIAFIIIYTLGIGSGMLSFAYLKALGFLIIGYLLTAVLFRVDRCLNEF